jgi:hypothetical protein
MHSLLLALVLSAPPVIPSAVEGAPALASLSGLNVGALKPWLIEQLPSLGQCVLPGVTTGDEVVSVQAKFGKSPEVSVLRVDGTLSDVACVRGVVDGWKRDSKQPSAGAFSFKYRFKPSAAQREAVAAQALTEFAALCALLPKVLTVESVRGALEKSKLPVGMRVTIEDALAESDSKALSRMLRDVAQTYKAEQCIR